MILNIQETYFSQSLCLGFYARVMLEARFWTINKEKQGDRIYISVQKHRSTIEQQMQAHICIYKIATVLHLIPTE